MVTDTLFMIEVPGDSQLVSTKISTRVWDLVLGRILWETRRVDYDASKVKSTLSEDDKYVALLTEELCVAVLDLSDPTQREYFPLPLETPTLSAIAVSSAKLVATVGFSYADNLGVPTASFVNKSISLRVKLENVVLNFSGRRLLAIGTKESSQAVVGYCWETRSLTLVQTFNFGMKASHIGIPSSLRIQSQVRVCLSLVSDSQFARDQCTTLILTAEGRSLGRYTGKTVAQGVMREASSDSVILLDDDMNIWKWNKFSDVPQRTGKLDHHEMAMEGIKALVPQQGRILLVMEDENVLVFSQGSE